MVMGAIFAKWVQNGLKFTFCLITLSVFEIQKTEAPFWKWHKNRVQMVQTIFESNEKLQFYVFLACYYTNFSKIGLVTIYMLQS